MIETMKQARRTGQCRNLFVRAGWMFALVLMLIAAGTASAQLTTADIVGTVTDPTGAIIPNANVTVVNLDTHETRNALSNASGNFDVTLLPVGRYSVTVKAKGFKNFVIPDLPVEAGDRAPADAHLGHRGSDYTSSASR
jgi:hypothetical protein